MSDRTLFLCKPDAVDRGLVGEIVGRLERRGLTIVAMDLRHIDVDLATIHYAEHDDHISMAAVDKGLRRAEQLARSCPGPRRRSAAGGPPPYAEPRAEGSPPAAPAPST